MRLDHWVLVGQLNTDRSSRFVASGYKDICTGGVGTVQCVNSPVFLSFLNAEQVIL